VDKNSEIKKTWYYRKCPRCKAKVHVDRKYCGCAADLSAEAIFYLESQAPPKIMYEKSNLDLPNYSCEICGAKCSYCASFGNQGINAAGFGSLECGHKQDAIKCACCRLMIKNFFEFPGDADKALDESIGAVRRILARRGTGNPETAQAGYKGH